MVGYCRPVRTIIAMCLVVAACGGKGAAVGTDPEATVRAFAQALADGDVARAQGLLMDDAACAAAPAPQVASCKQSAAAMRAGVPELLADFPKGAAIGTIARSKDATPDPSIVLWDVQVGGKPEQMMTVSFGGHVYPAFAVRAPR